MDCTPVNPAHEAGKGVSALCCGAEFLPAGIVL
jgi:hypothetical protein